MITVCFIPCQRHCNGRAESSHRIRQVIPDFKHGRLTHLSLQGDLGVARRRVGDAGDDHRAPSTVGEVEPLAGLSPASNIQVYAQALGGAAFATEGVPARQGLPQDAISMTFRPRSELSGPVVALRAALAGWCVTPRMCARGPPAHSKEDGAIRIRIRQLSTEVIGGCRKCGAVPRLNHRLLLARDPIPCTLACVSRRLELAYGSLAGGLVT